MTSIEEEIKQSKFKDPYEKAIVNLFFTSSFFQSRIKKILDEYKITNPQYNILRILNGAYPKPLNPGGIKEVMLFKSSDLTRLIDRLEKKSLVTRITCPENRRKVEILISQNGIDLLKSIRPRLGEIFKGIEKQLTHDEILLLSELLDKLRK